MEIIKEIEKNSFESECSENGARCYQNVRPLIALKDGQKLLAQYLHIVYPKIDNRDFDAFLSEIGFDLHKDLIDFYRKHNGFSLFSNSFVLYGFGRVCRDGRYLSSRGSDCVYLPYHLVDENDGRVKQDAIKIGSVCDSKLYYDNYTGTVSMDNHGTSESWASLDECIEDVYNRLDRQYLSNGIAKEPVVLGNLVFNKPDRLM